MLNQVVLVGRVVGVDIKEVEGVFTGSMTVEVERNYKNADGVYDVDTMEVQMRRGLAETALEEAIQGNLVGVKGILVTQEGTLKLFAEKISFLHPHDED